MGSTRRSAKPRRSKSGQRPSKQPSASPGRAEDRQAGWVLRCAPGLARLLGHELRFRKAIGKGDRLDVVRQRNHDLLFVKSLRKADSLPDLRIAEEVHRCLAYGRFKISNRQIDALARHLSGSGLGRKLVVTADGSHFDRRDLSRWITRQLAERGIRLSEGSERLLWVFCVDQDYYVCEPAFAHRAGLRPARTAEREGALPPTIAAAMAFAAKPEPGDLVLDPVCGSGTLLAEAAGYQKALRLIGFDIDRAAVKAARANLAQAEAAEIRQGDGAATDLEPGSVSLMLANLPFGKQFGDTRSNPVLYRSLIEEFMRVGRPGRWRAVLLTSDAESLRAALPADGGLSSQPLFTVKIRGEMASALLVTAGSADR